MNPVDVAAVALLVLFALVLTGGLVFCGLLIHWQRARAEVSGDALLPRLEQPESVTRPAARVARSRRTAQQRTDFQACFSHSCLARRRFPGGPVEFRSRIPYRGRSRWPGPPPEAD